MFWQHSIGSQEHNFLTIVVFRVVDTQNNMSWVAEVKQSRFFFPRVYYSVMNEGGGKFLWATHSFTLRRSRSCFSSLSHPTSIKAINLINVPHPETNQAFSFQRRGQNSPLSSSLLRKTRWHFVKSQCQCGSPPWSCDHLKVISRERFSPVSLRARYFCSWEVKGF